MSRFRLSAPQQRCLRDLYAASPRTVDDLPYTEDFESLFVQFVARTGLTLTRHDFWRALSSLRKKRSLPRKER